MRFETFETIKLTRSAGPMLNRFHVPRFNLGLLVCTALLLAGLCVPRPVSASVNSYGQFSTEIPIDVPPFHGLEPKLTLVYHSNPANGWIGAGWALSGGPSYIVRAFKGRGASRFDGSDIFLLDGMERVPYAPGSISPSCTSAIAAFGSSDGFYSTKTENFQRIRYVGSTDIFQMQSKSPRNGQTYQWALSTETDTHGNQVTYSYSLPDCRQRRHRAAPFHNHLQQLREEWNGARHHHLHTYYPAI